MSSVDVDSRGSLEDLDDGLATRDLENLSTASCSVGEGELDNLNKGRESAKHSAELASKTYLVVRGELDVVEDDEGSCEVFGGQHECRRMAEVGMKQRRPAPGRHRRTRTTSLSIALLPHYPTFTMRFDARFPNV